MNLHEYQAKELLKEFSVALCKGELAYTPREAMKACMNLGGGRVVVKAQVHAGGRGKGGGVKVAHNADEAYEQAAKILGMRLVTPQTGPQGKLVRKVWVEQACQIRHEYYCSLLVDRAQGALSIIVSPEGGMDIEEVAAKRPGRILTVVIRPESGLQEFHLRRVGSFLKLSPDGVKGISRVIHSLYAAFLAYDCTLLEINPLIETEGGEFLCLDAKMAVDDNALFRQSRAFALLDLDEIDEREIRAQEVGINYIALEGNIGCLVNGAGLAMATMDIIKDAGGKPANFLDVGGSATKETVREAFKLILQDPAVQGVLVNIFGGIVRCDVIAGGIIAAANELNLEVPLVVRLQGTNLDLGKKLLSESGLKIVAADTMDEAGKKIVELVAKGG